jgi:hypothetical protein
VVTTAQRTKAREDGLDPQAGDIDAGLTALTALTPFIIEARGRAG